MNRPDADDVIALLTSTRMKSFVGFIVAIGVGVGALYASYLFNGLFNTVVYAVVFVFFATVVPVSISLFGAAMPANGALGRAHLVLGAFAFDHPYLVQREDGWEMCPGDETSVCIDGEWHDIEGGLENRSVLGWRPFGILRYKDDGTWKHERVDDKALEERGRASADGGELASVERGGWQQADRPTVTGRGSDWLLDLKRVYSSGIQQMGDIELIETAEEVIERGQVDDGKLSGMGPALTFIASLIIGVIVGAGVLFLG